MTAIARLPGTRFPVKGWTLVTERMHPRIIDGPAEAIYRTAYGVTMKLDLTDYVQRNIFYDAWEAAELNVMLELLRHGDTMLDVGANVGLFSLVAARAVGSTGTVHAFEPIPENCERLRENVALNQLQNVRVNALAVGAGMSSISLGLDREMERTSGAAMSGFFTVGEGRRKVRVPMTSLDRYIAAAVSQPTIRFLKIDVEGYEPAVLAGLEKTLAARRVEVMQLEISLYALQRQGFAIVDVTWPLQQAGYRLYRPAPAGWLSRWAYRGEPSIPERPPGPVGFVRGVRMGFQDRRRQFNLLAVRCDHPAVKHRPRLLRPSSMQNGRS